MMALAQVRSKHGRRRSAERGFNLLELMITLVIIGTLAAFAIPAYQDSVRKSRRADAKSVLLQAAQWMERFYTENNCYSNALKSDGTFCAGTAVALPTSLSVSPSQGTTYYNITLAAVAQNSYTLNAAPVATTDQIKDACQTLTVDNTGAKGVTNGATLSAGDCWR